MKIAIIGTGISGCVAAYHLSREHEVSVFEANNYIGGHTNTHHINTGNGKLAIDSGFIVFNNQTYPNFLQLINELGVPYQDSCMSFSVHSEDNKFEYMGNTLNSLFAQRKNLFSFKFHRLLKEILRFNKQGKSFLESGDSGMQFGEFLQQGNYHNDFIKYYILPMGSAIWSTSQHLMMQFPARFFLRFFNNHGMLSIDDRPQWYVIKGGSDNYLAPLTKSFRHRIFLSSPVQKVRRLDSGIELVTFKGSQQFDAVFFACHSNQALKLIDQPTQFEQQVLSAFPYQKNTAVLHSDPGVMPDRKRAWASWNYRLDGRDTTSPPMLTYYMNRLQNLPGEQDYFVTLNANNIIDPTKIHRRIEYEHPLFTPESIRAQKLHQTLNGQNRCFYVGAYWRNGFHEDGVVSALNSLSHFQQWLSNEQLHLSRLG